MYDPSEPHLYLIVVIIILLAILAGHRIVEQDHRFIKKRIAASLWFRSVEGALQTVAGYEARHAIRKGQIRWLPKGDVVGQVQFIQRILGIAA